MKAAAFAASLLLAGCPVVGSNVIYSCKTAADCPPGYACNGGECVSPGGSTTGVGASSTSSAGTSSAATSSSSAASTGEASTGSHTSAGASTGSQSSTGTSAVATTGATAGATTGASSSAGPTSGTATGTNGTFATATAGATTSSSSTSTGSTSGTPSLVQLTSPQSGTVTQLRAFNGTLWLGQNWADEDLAWVGAGGLYSSYSGGAWVDETPALRAAGAQNTAIAAITADKNFGDLSYTYVLTTDGTLYYQQNGLSGWASAGDGGLPPITSMCSFEAGQVVTIGSGVLGSYTVTGAWGSTPAAVDGVTVDGQFSQSGDCWLSNDQTDPSEIYEAVSLNLLQAMTPVCPSTQVSFYDPADYGGSGGSAFLSFSTESNLLYEIWPFNEDAGANIATFPPPTLAQSRRGAMTHDTVMEYYGFLNQVEATPIGSTRPVPGSCGSGANGMIAASLPNGTSVNGLATLGTNQPLWVGTDRGLFTAPPAGGSLADAGFPGFAFIDAAQGGGSLYLLGTDQRVYLAAAGGPPVPWSNQPVLDNGVNTSHAIAAAGSLVGVEATYNNGNAELEVSSGSSFGAPVSNNDYDGVSTLRLAAFTGSADTYFYSWSDLRGPSLAGPVGVDGVATSGMFVLADAGGPDNSNFDQVAVAGDAGVYFLLGGSTSAQFSVDGFDFAPITISGLPPGAGLIYAAAAAPPAPVAVIDQSGIGFYLCSPIGSPPTSLECQHTCATTSGVTAVAYDSAGTLWVSAADGLHTSTTPVVCQLAAASPEPLRLVATVPGASGPGAVYVTGTTHSFLYQ